MRDHTLVVSSQFGIHQAVRAHLRVLVAVAAGLIANGKRKPKSETISVTRINEIITLKASFVKRSISEIGRLNLSTGAASAQVN